MKIVLHIKHPRENRCESRPDNEPYIIIHMIESLNAYGVENEPFVTEAFSNDIQ